MPLTIRTNPRPRSEPAGQQQASARSPGRQRRGWRPSRSVDDQLCPRLAPAAARAPLRSWTARLAPALPCGFVQGVDGPCSGAILLVWIVLGSTSFLTGVIDGIFSWL
jgi:hypothetical protein